MRRPGRTCRRRCGGRCSDHCWRRCYQGGGRRPSLPSDDRKTLLPYFEADNALLVRLTGIDYSDWLNEKGRGAFTERQ